MLQVIKEILKNPADKTAITLIFCNQTPADILLRKELDQLAASSRGQLKVHYVVDKNSSNDRNIKHVGYVTKAFLSTVIPAASSDALVYVCGPPPMLAAVACGKGPKGAQGEV